MYLEPAVDGHDKAGKNQLDQYLRLAMTHGLKMFKIV